jgi:ADP-ribosyl-[dinitrogen reductase] hydrolase
VQYGGSNNLAVTDRPAIQLAARLEGAVWGHLVGDAVGVPYEFIRAAEIGEVEMRGGGTWGKPAGTWSDDGALMLALLDSLLEHGFDTADQARRMLAWYRDGFYTPFREGRFDIGGTTRQALDAMASGADPETCGPSGDDNCGNGSLMRILPIALVERDISAAKLVDHAHRASRLTHGHPRAQVACALYVLVARRLLTDDVSRDEALALARANLRSVYQAADDNEFLAALHHLEGWTERAGRGRVWDSFWSAWDAFAGAESYGDTIQRAIAYGNDTDTTAAIAGGLAGIWWGNGTPLEWRLQLRDPDTVRPLVAKLLTQAGYRTDPIRVDWVDQIEVPGLHDAPGAVGMTFLPGRQDRGDSGFWWRDLETDISRLRKHHAVDTLLVLVEDEELREAHVLNLAEACVRHGIEMLRYQIRDQGVPDDKHLFGQMLDGMRNRIDAGKKVVVVCHGGLGRTGTTVACLLVNAGMSADDAIKLTRRTRKGTIENPKQELFVREWRPRPQASRS